MSGCEAWRQVGYTFRMSCLRKRSMNALRETISFWVGLGPSVVGEKVKEAIKLKKLSSCLILSVFQPPLYFLCFHRQFPSWFFFMISSSFFDVFLIDNELFLSLMSCVLSSLSFQKVRQNRQKQTSSKTSSVSFTI